MSVLRAGRGRVGGGGGGVEVFSNSNFFSQKQGGEKCLRFFSLLNFFFQKCSLGSETHAQNFVFFFPGWGADFGVPHAPTRGSRGVGKRYTSSYDHDM